MKKIIYLFIFLFSIRGFTQTQNLIGEWFLDRIVYSDGKPLEINNSKYSMFLSYKIQPNELIIYNIKFKAKYYKDKINLENRTFKYWFEDDYLVLQEGKEVSLFLKAENFIKKYPEFNPKYEIRNKDSLLVANPIIHPVFNYKNTFNDFLTLNMTQQSSKDSDDLYFKAEYTLTKNNKINYVKIINSRNPQYDTQFIQALKKAEQYFENPFGKDLLITEEKHFLKWGQHLSAAEEKELYRIIGIGSKYYDSNDFEKAIQHLSKLDSLVIRENRFTTRIKDGYLRLGISYLALGKNDDACRSFKKVGNLTDFAVRNYLIDFCKK